jgi:pyruvate dehydrogenase E1 component
VPWVTRQMRGVRGAIVAASDYMRIVAEQIRPFLPSGMPYVTLGTDGFGRSDSRERLRTHFQVNRYFIAIAALNALADDGVIGRTLVQDALSASASMLKNPLHRKSDRESCHVASCEGSRSGD